MFTDPEHRQIQPALNDVLRQHAQRTGGKPYTPLTGNETRYKQFQASKWPCNCAYIYGGVNTKYNFFQYGCHNRTYNARDSPHVGTSEHAGDACEMMINVAGSALLRRIGTNREAADMSLRNYVVANEYENEMKCIGEHSDADDLFGAKTAETVIFSLNVSRDGIFCVKPQFDRAFAEAVGLRLNSSAADKDAWKLAVYAPENSLFVMGGHFQTQMWHWTESHNAIAQNIALERQGGRMATAQYMKASKFCVAGSPRQVWDLETTNQLNCSMAASMTVINLPSHANNHRT